DLLRCLQSLNIRWFFGMMYPHDDAFLPVPQFPLLGNSGGDYQSVFCLSLLKTLAMGFGSACAHASLSALSRQLPFWIRSNGTLHGFLDFSQIHYRKVGVPLQL
ncbi:hypothetical protein Tco_0775692, partial [Tanacetum coccineum]